MQFSLALIALVAGAATALPVAGNDGQDRSPNGQPGHATTSAWNQWTPKATTSAWNEWTAQPTPAAPAGGQAPKSDNKGQAPKVNGNDQSPKPATTPAAQGSNWQSIGKVNTNQKVKAQDNSPTADKSNEKVKSSATSPAPKAEFSAPGAELKNKLGNPPSDTCAWDFVLTCAQHVYQNAGSCLNTMAKGTDNCFSDSTCSSAIGSDASTCATCFNEVGKQKFVTAIYSEKDNTNVAPIFTALVSYGVCDNKGQVSKA